MAVTLASLRSQARQRADQVNSQFCTDAEVNQYLNNSAAELYDLLVATFEDQYVSSSTLNVVGGTDTYSLPTDFYKLLGVDLIQGVGVSGKPVSLRPFMFAERNNYAYVTSWNYLNFVNIRYRLQGSKIRFVPVPDGNYTLTLWYVPVFTQLANDTDTLDGVNGFEEYVIVDAAIKMLQKEESDVSVLMAQKEALRQRIMAMAANRDAGAPQRIVDVAEQDFDPFFRRMP